MANETTAPFSKAGPSWAAILKLLGWASPFLIGAAMLYLGKEFATHSEVQAAVAPLTTVPAQVQSLQEFRGRAEVQQQATAQVISVIQQDLSAIKALQSEATRNTDRILRKLDRTAEPTR